MGVEMLNLSDDDALLAWADAMLLGDEVDLTGAATLPINTDVVRCWAVQHRSGVVPPTGVPAPSYRLTSGLLCQSVWFLRKPAQLDQTRATNAWRMTMAMLCAALDGRELTEIANPLPAAEHAEWTGAATDITTMKSSLEKAGYRKHRFYTEARSKGGSSMTAAQTTARRANLVAARAVASQQAAEKADAYAHQLVSLADAGRTDAEIAEATGLAQASLKTTLARARRRIGWQPPNRHHELDELTAILNEEPSNVVPLHRSGSSADVEVAAEYVYPGARR